MGLKKQLYRDFMRDPHKQYYDKLGKLLNVYKIGKTSKKEVLNFVTKWSKE